MRRETTNKVTVTPSAAPASGHIQTGPSEVEAAMVGTWGGANAIVTIAGVATGIGGGGWGCGTGGALRASCFALGGCGRAGAGLGGTGLAGTKYGRAGAQYGTA